MNKIESFINYVNNNYLGDIFTNQTFKNLTTLKIGGEIACLYRPKNLDDLILSFKYIIENKIPYFVIGNGSNILASDHNFKMIVISLKNLSKITKIKNNLFLVEAGISDNNLSLYLAKLGYTKCEFLSIIPGTLGGAIYMNAGAYNMEIKDIIKEVTYISGDGKLITKTKDELEFSYRSSIFKNEKAIIVSALIEVEEANIKSYPKEKIATLRSIKKDIQPINLLSAGSTFKNGTNYEAWKVVDNLGYRGYSINDAMVSTLHTNYIVNSGNATYQDMIELITKIKIDAKEKYNIDLECEWEILD